MPTTATWWPRCESNRAQSVADLTRPLPISTRPCRSVVAADQGVIAYKAVGKVPVRAADNDIRGVAPSPGWEARYDWEGWLPYEDTPQDAGERGWIATANQRITAPTTRTSSRRTGRCRTARSALHS